jgi:peptidoglycan/xylan/chitin deacetylase (PgdA/CDA1 family)
MFSRVQKKGTLKSVIVQASISKDRNHKDELKEEIREEKVSVTPSNTSRFSLWGHVRSYRVPKWLLILVGVPVVLSLVWFGVHAFREFGVPSYPEGDVTVEAFASGVPDYDFVPASYTYTDYSLPLSKLPANYEAVRDAFPGVMDREDMILILRDGFTGIPQEGDGVTSASIYASLLDKGIPLAITQDAVISYAWRVFDAVKADADQNMSETLSTFSKTVADEALRRSRSGDDAVRDAYLGIAQNYYLAYLVLTGENTASSDLRDDVDERFSEFEKSSGYVEGNLFLSALNCIEEGHDATSDTNLQAQLLMAGLVKTEALKDSWKSLSSYVSFFYDEHDALDISVADEVVRTTVGYGAADEDIVGSEVVDTLSERSVQPDSSELSTNVATEYSVVDVAAELGVQESCVASGTNANECVVRDVASDVQHGTYDEMKTWISTSMLSKEGSSFNYGVSSDWMKTRISRALWHVTSRVTEATGGVDESDSAGMEIPEDMTLFLDPNPELYARIAYESQVFVKGVGDAGLLSTDRESALSRLKAQVEQLTSISEHILSGTEVTDEERHQLRDLFADIEAYGDASYENTKAEILVVAVHATDGTLLLSAGPSFQYFPYDDGIPSESDQTTSFMSWLQVTVNNNNFNEPYDMPIVAQSPGTVRIPVLMYHQITPSPTTTAVRRLYVAPQYFEQQLAYLAAKNYRSLTPQEFYDILATGQNPPQKSVMLTFDDSVGNHYTEAFPLLKKYGFVGVFYVVSHRSGITAAQMKEMSDAGMIIDSHSETHRDLTKIDDASLWEEIAGSKAAIEGATGKQVMSMCYPGCVVDDRGIGMVASSGYILGFSCGSSIDHVLRNRFVLSRIHVYEEMDNFQKIFSGIWEIPASYYQ